MLAKKTSKNQLTLPKEIVKEFPDVDYFDINIQEHTIVLTPVTVKPVTTNMSMIREKMEKLGIDESDVQDAVSWARNRK